MIKMLHGKVHGKTIELDQDLGIAEGQEVEITVHLVPAPDKWGAGILRSAGAMAPYWTDEDDRILEQIQTHRGEPSRRGAPE
jgi:hypothetical protein